MLVGLILLDVLINPTALAIFSGRAQSLPHFVGFYGDRADDVADGFHHHHRQY